MPPFHYSVQEALEALKHAAPIPFVTMLQHGTMSVEYYAPIGIDNQTPHKKDELYIVVKGNGIFNLSGVKVPFNVGDVLFVPAGMEHRFENFSADFAAWVVFYGPDGGESV